MSDHPSSQTAPVSTPEETATNNQAANAPPQPNDTTTPPKQEDEKPPHLANNPALSTLTSRLPSILTQANHTEMWGVPLKDATTDIPTANILIKFLRANEGDPVRAEEQLTRALEWRREMDPVGLRENGRFSKRRFGGLGYQTTYSVPDDGREKEVVATWNIYGEVGDLEATFGDVDE